MIIIDDDKEDIELLENALLAFDASIRCIPFIDPLEAIEVMGQESTAIPHVVFIDFNMPIMNGAVCVRWFRNNRVFDNTIIVIFSTLPSSELSEKVITIGADFVFQKPFRHSGYADIFKQIFVK